LGVIIHHQNDLLLKNTVFINTDWCVDGMYKVLDDKSVFQNNGKFSNADLIKIWEEDKRFESKQAELIKLMINYNLCFELSDGSGFIAPDLLPPDRPENLQWTLESALLFEYRYKFMPAGMLSRFIVKSHSFIKDNLFWKYGTVLTYDNTETLVEEDYINNKIKISLKGENKKGLLSAVRMFIEEIHRNLYKSKKLVFEEMIPCNCSECVTSTVPHFFEFKSLKKFEQRSITEAQCAVSGEMVKVRNLINDVQVSNFSDHLETNEDLKEFILNLLNDVLQHEVSYKGGHLNFWRDKGCKKPKNEVEIHPYLCNTLDNYCKTKGINLSREVKEANGNVDIEFSYTNRDNRILKVCVEVKKAHHPRIETAIATQLPAYMESARTQSGIYLVIWFKNDSFKQPIKYNSLNELQEAIEKNNRDKNNISVKIINCCRDISPSKI
jgi:hypothetical protein